MGHMDYVIRGGVQGRERLRILARVMQPFTQSLLERSGLARGMSCLDAGCGGGDVTFEIARMVGPRARVVGLDADQTKIAIARGEAADLDLPNVEFCAAEVGGSLPEERFDFVYARFLLTHLPDPSAAVAWMRAHLGPRGIIAVEDIDFTGQFCHPDHEAVRRYAALYTHVVQKRGADPNIGPRLPGFLLDGGFAKVQMNVVQAAGFEGEVKLIAAITMENIADSVLAEGLASREEIDGVVRELYALADDHRTVMSLPRVVQAWGTLPD